jgi:hypothetical protein
MLRLAADMGARQNGGGAVSRNSGPACEPIRLARLMGSHIVIRTTQARPPTPGKNSKGHAKLARQREKKIGWQANRSV